MAYNKTPFKMAGKSPLMKQLIGKQDMLPEGLQSAIKASPAKKHDEGRLGVDAGETAAFEKSKEVEHKFDRKIERAGGFGVPNEDGSSPSRRVNRLVKRSNKQLARKVPRAKKKADEKGYDMANMDGTTTFLKPKNQKASPAKQVATPKELRKDLREAKRSRKASPAKEIDKAGQRIQTQTIKKDIASAAGNERKAKRHADRATRMNDRDIKKKTKENRKNSPAKKDPGAKAVGIAAGMTQEAVDLGTVTKSKTRAEHRLSKQKKKLAATDDKVVGRRRAGRVARLEKKVAKQDRSKKKRYQAKEGKVKRQEKYNS